MYPAFLIIVYLSSASISFFFFWLEFVFCEIGTDDKNYDVSMVSKILIFYIKNTLFKDLQKNYFMIYIVIVK